MTRLIDGDELLRRYDEEHEGPPGRARKLIEEAPTVVGWISTKDRMPEKYLDVLVLVQYPKVNGYTGHYVVIAWKSTDDDSWDSDDNNFNNDPEGVVTHWMFLPEPPKEGHNADTSLSD